MNENCCCCVRKNICKIQTNTHSLYVQAYMSLCHTRTHTHIHTLVHWTWPWLQISKYSFVSFHFDNCSVCCYFRVSFFHHFFSIVYTARCSTFEESNRPFWLGNAAFGKIRLSLWRPSMHTSSTRPSQFGSVYFFLALCEWVCVCVRRVVVFVIYCWFIDTVWTVSAAWSAPLW